MAFNNYGGFHLTNKQDCLPAGHDDCTSFTTHHHDIINTIPRMEYQFGNGSPLPMPFEYPPSLSMSPLIANQLSSNLPPNWTPRNYSQLKFLSNSFVGLKHSPDIAYLDKTQQFHPEPTHSPSTAITASSKHSYQERKNADATDLSPHFSNHQQHSTATDFGYPDDSQCHAEGSNCQHGGNGNPSTIGAIPTQLSTHPSQPNGIHVCIDTPRRKNATRETTATLKSWLQEHSTNPYPTKCEKIMLAIITKMTYNQVSTWFANARRRLKKDNKMTWSPKICSGDSRPKLPNLITPKIEYTYSSDEEEEADDDDDKDNEDDRVSESKRGGEIKGIYLPPPLTAAPILTKSDNKHPWYPIDEDPTTMACSIYVPAPPRLSSCFKDLSPIHDSQNNHSIPSIQLLSYPTPPLPPKIELQSSSEWSSQETSGGYLDPFRRFNSNNKTSYNDQTQSSFSQYQEGRFFSSHPNSTSFYNIYSNNLPEY